MFCRGEMWLGGASVVVDLSWVDCCCVGFIGLELVVWEVEWRMNNQK